jgi:hypothetical protein
LINASRGTVVEIEPSPALRAKKKPLGAAIDVSLSLAATKTRSNQRAVLAFAF